LGEEELMKGHAERCGAVAFVAVLAGPDEDAGGAFAKAERPQGAPLCGSPGDVQVQVEGSALLPFAEEGLLVAVPEVFPPPLPWLGRVEAIQDGLGGEVLRVGLKGLGHDTRRDSGWI